MNTNNSVVVEDTSKMLADDLFALIKNRISTFDIFSLDMVYVNTINDNLDDNSMVVDFNQEAFNSTGFIPGILDSYYDGRKRLIAVPFYNDFGLLYCRLDLCKKYKLACPPKTYDELETYARVIQQGERAAGNPSFNGFIWTGRYLL